MIEVVPAPFGRLQEERSEEKELTLLIYLGQDLAFSGIEMSPSARVKSHYNFALSKM